MFDKDIWVTHNNLKFLEALKQQGLYPLHKHLCIPLINHHFYLTTSSSQTNYYNDVIQPKYAKAQSMPNVNVLNILDGAGWIGRAADFKKVFADCNYFLNLKSIDKLNDIIKEFFNI